jgi:hypothetical protein
MALAIALTVAQSAQLGSTANAATYVFTPAFLPTANAKLVVVAHAGATSTGSISGTGATWNAVISQDTQGAGYSERLFESDMTASPSSVSMVANYTGDNASGCAAVALSITGQTPNYAPRQTTTATSIGPNPTVTFTNPVSAGNGAVVALLMTGAVAKVTAPANWTTVPVSFTGTAPTAGLVVAYGTNVSGTTFVFSTGALTGLGYFGAEYYLSGTEPAVLPGIDPMGMMGFFGA